MSMSRSQLPDPVVIQCTRATLCSQAWSEMPVGARGERTCPTCKHIVHEVSRRSEYEAHVKAGNPVAARPGVVTLLDEEHPFVDPQRPIGILGSADDLAEVRTAIKTTRKLHR